ncbi:MAG: response regulator [Acidobacteriaceae bacterium]
MPSVPPTRHPRTHASTILVVEDDRSIRYLFTEVLRNAGYEVIACEDGAVGLAMARERVGAIHAVITDSTMPGLDGREMIAAIRSLSPQMPILVVSGSVDHGREGAVPDPEDSYIVYLCKPISPERLTVELKNLLASLV